MRVATFPNGEGMGLCVSFGFPITANAYYKPRDVEDAVPYSVNWQVRAVAAVFPDNIADILSFFSKPLVLFGKRE